MQAPAITTALAGIRRREQIDEARAHRRAGAAAAGPPAGHDDVTIRLARPGDAAALERLAQLDGRGEAPLVAGAGAVVAVVDGSVVAARGLRGGAISDPFRAAPEVVALLEVRARQLAGHAVSAPRARAPRRTMPVLRVGGAR